MADIRIKDLATTATTTASDDFMAVDGATNGTRKMNAATPAFLTSVTTPSLTSPAATNLTLGTGTYGTALTVASATGAVTATTTLADQGGTISSQRNGLAPRQGLVFDGTAGTTFANSTAFGTGDFSIFTWATADTFTAAPICDTASGTRLSFSLDASGPYVYNGSVLRPATVVLSTGRRYCVGIVRLSGQLYSSVDGVLYGPVADATNYSVAVTLFGIVQGSSSKFTGALGPLYAYNRAFSAAEVLALYQSGAPTGADYNTASNTALSLGNFANSGYETFTGASATGFTAINTSVDGYAYTTNQFTLIKGARYRMTFTCALTSGQVPVAYLGVPGSSVLSVQTRIAAGANVLEFTATASGASNGVFYSFNGEAVSYAISSFALTPLGLLLAPDSNNAGAGLEWLDVSGNRAHIVLPTSGVSWSLPSSQQIVIEASTSTNGNQQLGGASLIDANKQWRIQSWTVNCSTGTPTISLGNVSAGAQFVSGAVMASGNNDITLVTRFPSTANLWANSNSTATLIHRITLVPAN
jgi:hypothetical protein